MYGRRALVEPCEHGGGLGHLHEGEDPLHHARTSGCADDNQWKIPFQGVPPGTGDLLSDDGPPWIRR